MKDETPQGVTDSERFLSELCSRTFLYIWSYANPFKDDGHEFCDVLAVFENHVFIFFDREKVLSDFIEGEDPSVRWSRWKRNVVDRQVKAARGAERYLRSGRKIYLDAKKTRELPIPLKLEDVTIHKIIVAHGATEACKNFSESNIHGSLAISYGESANIPEWPFIVHLGLFDVSSGMEDVEHGVDGRTEQVDDAREGSGVAIASGASAGCLEQPIERFEAGIGMA